MTDELKNALIVAVVGFAIMIAGSVALWFFHAHEVICSIILVIGLILVVFGIIYASKPEFVGNLLGKFKRPAIPKNEDNKEGPN